MQPSGWALLQALVWTACWALILLLLLMHQRPGSTHHHEHRGCSSSTPGRSSKRKSPASNVSTATSRDRRLKQQGDHQHPYSSR